jgi:hypothetical protein
MNRREQSVMDIEASLVHEREYFLRTFDRVPTDRRSARPASGGWSAVEVAEHVSRVERGVVKMLTAGATMRQLTSVEELESAQLTEQKIHTVRVRAEKVQAPERAHPTGGFDADSVVSELAQSRAALLEAFRAADPAVLDRVTYPHPFIGPLTLRAWVELVAHHDARHAQQVQDLVP